MEFMSTKSEDASGHPLRHDESGPRWETKEACYCVLGAQLCLTLLRPNGPWQAPLFMGFSRQEYWSGLPFSSLEDLPDPGIELASPAL